MSFISLYSSSGMIKTHFFSYCKNIQVCLVTKRWAGHSKWQNIKHTKTLKDVNKSLLFSKLCKKISIAVKEGGENPDFNYKLKICIDEARKISMPNATIQNAIKKANLSAENPSWLIYTRSDGLICGFEIASSNMTKSISKINQHTKKLQLKLDKSPNICTEKGIILCDSIEGGYEKAVEDGINIGVNEVEEADDKTLVFQCFPSNLDKINKQLISIGYNIQSISTELEFPHHIKVKEEDENLINMVMEKISSIEELLRAVNNIEKVTD